MESVTPRYLVDENQLRTDVVLSIGQWQHILEELEELEDLRAYDEAESGDQEKVSFDGVVSELRQGQSG
jgi:hypothetical protein